jgi:hypothetical protein
METSKAAPDRVVYRIKMQDGLGNCQMLGNIAAQQRGRMQEKDFDWLLGV